MNKSAIVAIVVVLVLIVGGLLYWYSNQGTSTYAPQTSTTPQPYQPYAPSGPTSSTSANPTAPSTPVNQTPAPTPSPTPTPTPNPTPTSPAPQSFSVHGNDSTGDPTAITVNKGASVSITFTADAQGTYHGGLDFRSSVVSTGPIAPGSSKTVTFTANQSFAFTPYWPSTNIAKPYKITVTVQ